jgi:hypothetical protein
VRQPTQMRGQTLTSSVDYQLGNGKRSSLAVPQHLPPLVQRLVDPTGAVAAEAGLSSGTVRLSLPL